MWDLTAGRAYTTLTHHKKSVRAMCLHPRKFIFASGSADNLKQWKMPEGTFMKNMDVEPYRAIVNCMAVNHDDVTVCVRERERVCVCVRQCLCVVCICMTYWA